MYTLKHWSVIMALVVCVSTLSIRSEDAECKTDDGVVYASGEGYLDDDGCNRCTCMDGLIGCTEMWCEAPQGCNYNGNIYILGQTFMDDCNTCRCSNNGAVACTRDVCPPEQEIIKPDQEVIKLIQEVIKPDQEVIKPIQEIIKPNQ